SSASVNVSISPVKSGHSSREPQGKTSIARTRNLIVVQATLILGEGREQSSDSLRARSVTKRTSIRNLVLVVSMCAALGTATEHHAAQTGSGVSSPIGIAVTFTDIAKAAGLTFKQDSTAT